MQRSRAYKFRFYPTPQEVGFLAEVFGCCRFVYNHFLEEKQRTLSYSECSEKLSELKKEFSFLKEIPPLPKIAKTTGIDLGLTHAFVTSDGEKKSPSNALKKLQKKQRVLSRKKQGSANRTKAKKKVASVCRKVQNQRLDAIHKMTTALVHENQVICAEKLSVKNMMKNKKLARSIGDAGWGTFLRCLEYKCDWYGRLFVQADPFFSSSKQCHSCYALYENLSLKDRFWTCPNCKVLHDRDVNAAKNIEKEGLKKIDWSTVGLTGFKAWGADVRPMWQTTEPSAENQELELRNSGILCL